MKSFRNFDWMPQRLSDFLFHLSSPSTPPEFIKEATVFDIHNRKPSAAPEHPSVDPKAFPVTHSLITRARKEMPNENLHKRIAHGFKTAFHAMSGEDEKTRKAKVGESHKVWDHFVKQRGYKSGKNISMLGENGKTKKSTGEGVHTKGLTLAPHTTSGLHGFDVCPRASSECRKNCLGLTAGGNKQYPDSALSSKVLRTHFVAHHPEHAARMIDHEVGNHAKSAKKKGFIPGVRMNVTSDFSWEHHAPELFHRHKDVQFYDYTKMHNRVGHPNLPKNYHLSLSHTGANHAESNDHHAAEALHKGHVVAMVYHRGKDVPHPTHVEDMKTGKRFPVANGDDDDNTFDRHAHHGLTPGKAGHGVVSGLKLKGVKNEAAGHFANKVDHDGIIRINHPKTS